MNNSRACARLVYFWQPLISQSMNSVQIFMPHAVGSILCPLHSGVVKWDLVVAWSFSSKQGHKSSPDKARHGMSFVNTEPDLCRTMSVYRHMQFHSRMQQIMLMSWWRRQMETFSALLTICAGNSPVPGEFPAQRPVMRSFDIVFDLRLNKRLSKHSWGWWFTTPLCPLWRHCNGSTVWRTTDV